MQFLAELYESSTSPSNSPSINGNHPYNYIYNLYPAQYEILLIDQSLQTYIFFMNIGISFFVFILYLEIDRKEWCAMFENAVLCLSPYKFT